MKKIFLNLLGILLLSTSVYSQIGIHPQAIFLDTKNRSGYMKIYNSSNSPKEVSIDMVFGYPGYDSLGQVTMYLGDTLKQAVISAKPYVKIFPKKLLLAANEEQVVRFMLKNVSDLKEGTYVSRVQVKSKTPPDEIDTTYTDKIKAKIDIHFTLMAALIVQKGKQVCNMSVEGSSVSVDSANVNILVSLKKSGNAPFYGTSEMTVTNSSGDEIATSKEMTPFYFSSQRAFKFDKSLFKKGRYKVDLYMSNEHKDVPENFKIPFTPLETSFFIDLESVH